MQVLGKSRNHCILFCMNLYQDLFAILKSHNTSKCFILPNLYIVIQTSFYSKPLSFLLIFQLEYYIDFFAMFCVSWLY